MPQPGWQWVAACLALAAADAAHATTYYVATDGSDTNPGTLASPFATLQHAAGVVRAGGTVHIRGGTYYEDRITLTESGTSAARITFASYPGETAVIDFGLRVPSPWQLCTHLAQPSACAKAGYPNLYAVKPSYGPASHYHWPSTTRSVIINGRIHSPVPCRSTRPTSECLQNLQPGQFFSGTADKGADYGYLYVNPADSLAVPAADASVTIVNFSANPAQPFPTGLYTYNPNAPDAVASHLVLKGLTLQGGAFGVMIGDPAGTHVHADFTIVSSKIQYSYFQAIAFRNWDTATVSATEAAYNGLYDHPRGTVDPGWPVTIYGVNAEHINIVGNSIHDNDGEGVGPGAGCTFWLIAKNSLHGNYSAEIYVNTDGKNGLTGSYDGGHTIVDGNLIYETGKYAQANPANPYDIRNYPVGIGIANEAATPTQGTGQAFDTVTNNIITGAGSAGIRVLNYGRSVFALTGSLIAHNTVAFMFDSLAGGWKKPYYGLQIEVSDNVHVDNNIVYPNPVQLASRAAAATGITARNNLVASPSDIHAGGRVSVSGTVAGDPDFCSGGSKTSPGHYGLRAGSAARNAGYIVPAHADGNVGTLAHDYFGDTRPDTSAPDIGFQQHAGLAPPCRSHEERR